ncbi:MAG: double-strand break repair helicase AddA [Stappiaceae bacterium]
MISVPSETLAKQNRASQPEASAWVSANAGSGKTFVLAQRVVRLLLNGTDPARILCLTFTKAAAAEMSTRVFRILGSWATRDDSALAKEILAIEGKIPPKKELSRARRLFARALETPGGLKIQTIHAFCEALLHQFPLEADVAGHFSVLDERLQNEMLEAGRAHILRQAMEHPESDAGAALAELIDLMSDFAVEEAINEVISKRDVLQRWISAHGGLQQAIENLRSELGLKLGESLESNDLDIVNSPIISRSTWLSLAQALSEGSKSDQKKADLVLGAANAADIGEKRKLWLSVFLTKSAEPAKRLVTKAVLAHHPQLADQLLEEQTRLLAILERRKALITMTGTQSLLYLANAVRAAYERQKAELGLLDFEDLVVRTATLLSQGDAALWVQYKLDNGLDHILVDEAQDTSPRQWEIITALAGEFFSGHGARPTVRTVFAVGDEKQSIYSFQGAEPAYFANMRKLFLKQATAAKQTFNDIRLNLSFRSTNDVLGAVDSVFSTEETYRGLSQEFEPTVHEGIRNLEPGLIEIWSPELPLESEPSDDWTAPIDREGAGSPIVRLAERMADRISGMISSGQSRAGDILVLMRKRGPFIEALNRALKSRDVPVAGSDRLVLTDHIVVKDLIALGRFILLTEDDLSLATILKSPLIGLNEEQLFDLAHDRSSLLFSELARKGEEDLFFRSVHKRLSDWRDRAEFMPPFEFFSRVLGIDDGRYAFRARLGAEVDDVLDEFLALTLDYESQGIPVLEGFLDWLEAAPTQIKRELSADADLLRIMTVHGAKGLEAKVVFLVDTGSKPVHASHDPAILEKSSDDPLSSPALVWLPSKVDRPTWAVEQLIGGQEKAREEYRRLLYVAMTRAEDQLIVCGWAPKTGVSEDCWHSLVQNALEPDAEEVLTAEGDVAYWRWQSPGKRAGEQTVDDLPPQKAGYAGEPMPDWFDKPVKSLPRKRRLVPSNAMELISGEAPESDEWTQGAVAVTLDHAEKARARGTLMHQLFELLPDIEPTDREQVAQRLAERESGSLSSKDRDELIREVLTNLDDPRFADVFSSAGRSEVSVVGTLTSVSGKAFEVAGKIDRLVISENEVLIVDFKSNYAPPSTTKDVPVAYLAQLGIYYLLMKSLYPTHKIRTGLLWTRSSTLMEIDGSTLEPITRSFIGDDSIA